MPNDENSAGSSNPHDDQQPSDSLAETVTVALGPGIPVATAPEIDGYLIAQKLGEGGMGAVYQATQLATQRAVALKVMSARAIGSEKARRRFEREVELASGLEHPNIARVYDSGVAEGVYFYAMRLVSGLSLADYVRKQELDLPQILAVMGKVCRGVEFAHRKGVIHRDLKPQNIMVDAAGEPYVLDFGLAKALDDEATQLSMDGDCSGTPAYMSPEQAAGRIGDIDTRTDVYALGVILYRLLLKEHPHVLKGSPYDVMRRVIADDPIRQRSVNPAFDIDLEAILLKCLEKDPGLRYGSAGGLSDDLERYLNNEPVTAQAATLGYFLRKGLVRHRAAVALSIAIVTLLAIGLLSYIQAINAEQARTDTARQEAVDNEARALAEAARATRAEQEARIAEQQALDAEQAAKASEKRSRQRAYNNSVALAQQVALDGNAEEARRLLNSCDPDLRHFEWHYLKQRFADRSRKLPRAERVDWSRQGDRVALLQKDGNGTDFRAIVCYWFTGEKVAVFELASPGGDVAISPDGAYLVTGGQEGAVWDIDAKRRYAELPGLSAPVHRLVWSADGKFAAGGGKDGEVTIWQMPDAIEIGRLTIDVVHDLAISADGKLLLVAGAESAGVWEVASLSRRHESKQGGRLVDFSPDAGSYVVMDGNSRLTIHDTESGRILKRGQLGTNGGGAWVKWSPDGKHIAAFSSRTYLFDAQTLTEVARFRGGGDAGFSPDGQQILMHGTPSRVVATTLPADPVNWAGTGNGVPAFSPDGRWLVAGSRLFNRHTGMLAHTFQSPGWVDRMAFSPDGEWLAAATRNDVVVVWRTSTGALVHRFSAETSEKCYGIAFSPDSSRLATPSADGIARIWSLDSGELSLSLAGKARDWMPGIAWDPLDRYIATVGGGYVFALWDAHTGELVREVPYEPGRRGYRGDIVFSPDGTRIAVCRNMAGKHLGSTIFDVETGIRIAVHPAPAQALATSHDGRRLYAAGESGEIWVLDFATGELVLKLAGGGEPVRNIAVDPDGQLIASHGSVSALRFWGVPPVFVPKLLPGQVQDLRTLPISAEDSVQGDWRHSDNSLTNASGNNTDRIELPLHVQGSYKVRMAFSKRQRADSRTVSLILPVRERQVLLALDHMGRGKSGLEMLDGAPVGAPQYGGPNSSEIVDRLLDDRRYELEVTVTVDDALAEIIVRLDGRDHIQWRGHPDSLALHDTWRLRKTNTIGIGAGDCHLNVHAFSVEMLDGHAVFARPPMQPPPGFQALPETEDIDLLRLAREQPLSVSELTELPLIPPAVMSCPAASNPMMTLAHGSYFPYSPGRLPLLFTTHHTADLASMS